MQERTDSPTLMSTPPERVWRMFDRIAPRYDTLNRVLSFRRDVVWRKRMARELVGRHNIRLLDLATGTGDQILHFMDGGADIASAVGIDMAAQMIAQGQPKLQKRHLADRVTLQTGDATAIPFEADAFDVVSISFGIRNVADVATS
ncbi:MAG: class I SAM-dependent methyltransferase, partial [Verrucomicrobia bacterium]|nr:class I SAM-dependent methyltransferase [Verrucomicrobiota bacterium]